jgi:hypothetical protein
VTDPFVAPGPSGTVEKSCTPGSLIAVVSNRAMVTARPLGGARAIETFTLDANTVACSMENWLATHTEALAIS